MDWQTAVLPAQTGIFLPTPHGAEAPRLLGFPSVALQEHPAGASCSVAMEMQLRRSPGAVPLGGLQDPLPHHSPSPWLFQEIKVILELH